MHNTKMLILLN